MSKMSYDNFDDLHDWLRQYNIDCTYAKLHRHFSNGVALATLLKELYPRLVDLHNYPPQNSIRLKLENLETLNAKVLAKIGLQQKPATLENIAKGMEGAIEGLLYQIMELVREEERKKENAHSSEENLENVLLQEDQGLEITVNKKIGDALVKVPQRMVLYSLYEKTVQEVEEKKEKLKSLEMRLFQAENELEQKRNEVEKLIRHEENREYRKRLAVKSNILALIETQRLEREKNSCKLQKSVRTLNAPNDIELTSTTKKLKDSSKSIDKSSTKSSSLYSSRKNIETVSMHTHKARKTSRIPQHILNVK